MTPEIYNDLFSQRIVTGYFGTVKIYVEKVGGTVRRYCTCGTVNCDNYKTFHDAARVWVPLIKYEIDGFFEERFPQFRWLHKFGSKNVPPMSEVTDFTLGRRKLWPSEWKTDYFLVDEFMSHEYQSLLGHRRPTQYVRLWFGYPHPDQDFLDAKECGRLIKFLDATTKYLNENWCKKKKANLVAQVMMHGTKK